MDGYYLLISAHCWLQLWRTWVGEWERSILSGYIASVCYHNPNSCFKDKRKPPSFLWPWSSHWGTNKAQTKNCYRNNPPFSNNCFGGLNKETFDSVNLPSNSFGCSHLFPLKLENWLIPFTKLDRLQESSYYTVMISHSFIHLQVQNLHNYHYTLKFIYTH